MFDLTALVPGDAILTADRGVRIVVRVLDTDGARGGLVDTKPTVGRYSRSSGFELGDEILGFACACGDRRCLGCDADCGTCAAPRACAEHAIIGCPCERPMAEND